MTTRTKNELLEVNERLADLSKQFLQMIDHISRLEQGQININAKLNIHIKEGHKPNEQRGADI
tara:strand:- start:262 stop:450 length:189 start_codon:yes stop_codon:yes gene_type:complete